MNYFHMSIFILLWLMARAQPEHLGLCRAECLNAELSGAWPMVGIQRFKIDTFMGNAVKGITE